MLYTIFLHVGFIFLVVFNASASFAQGDAPNHNLSEEEVILSQAISSYQNADFQESLRILDGLIQKNTQHIFALHLKAVVLLQQNKAQESQLILEQLLNMPSSVPVGLSLPQVYFELGLSYYKQDKLDLAQKYLKQAIRYEPRRASAYYLLATVCYSFHQYEDAAQHYKMAASLSDKDTVLANASMYYRGEALLRAGKDEEARRAFAFVTTYGDKTAFFDLAKKGGTLQSQWGEASAFISLGGYFDSNLLLLGRVPQDKTALPGGRFVLDAGANYTSPALGPVDVGVGIFVYQNLNFSKTDEARTFNLTQGSAKFEIAFRLSKTKPIQDRLAFGYVGTADFIHGQTNLTQNSTFNFYSAKHHPYIRFEWRQGKSWYSHFQYTFLADNFNSTLMGITDPLSVRSFLGHQLSVSQNHLIKNRLGRVSLGIYLQYEDAKGQRWDSVTPAIFANTEIFFARKWSVNGDVQVSLSKYLHDDRLKTRLDTQLHYGMGLTFRPIYQIGVHLAASFEHQFSQLPIFRYDRYIAGLYVSARY